MKKVCNCQEVARKSKCMEKRETDCHRRKAIITEKIYRIPEMLPLPCIKHNGTNKYSYKAFSSFLRHIDCCF